MAITLNVNGEARTVEVEPDTPLLWVLRDTLGLTGTKFGCGIAACGACTVHLDGRAVRTCTLPVSAAEGVPITTIEGLAGDGRLHAVQQAWIDHQVPQCGYCQSGMIMAVSALLAQRPDPSDEHIDAAVTNICRCGTFVRVRRAIHAAARGGGAQGGPLVESDTVGNSDATVESGTATNDGVVTDRAVATEAGTGGGAITAEAAANSDVIADTGVAAGVGKEASHG